MVSLRRDIHRNPEIGWQETRTTGVVADLLKGWGLEPNIREAGTGLVVEVGGGEPIVGFRADLNGLSVQEEGTADYRSTVPGVMHGCGHDAHTAIGTGIAGVLSRADRLPGTVRILFQPAEEQLPSGGMALVEEGVHKGLKAILAFHVDPAPRRGEDRTALRRDHERLGPVRNHAPWARRAYVETSPDGRPYLRSRPGDHKRSDTDPPRSRPTGHGAGRFRTDLRRQCRQRDSHFADAGRNRSSIRS